VTAGQELKDFDFKLTPQGVITGRVVDEEGEPVSLVQLQILRRSYMLGKQQFIATGASTTNDIGEFRAAALAAGRYWLNATYLRPAATRNGDRKPEESYVTTYYPSATDESGARPIDLEAGQEMSGIEIRLRKARTYRVKGKVLAATGPLPVNMRVVLIPRESKVPPAGVGMAAGSSTTDGTFEIVGVQPGSYFLAVGPTPIAAGRIPLTVASENVENVVLGVEKAATLTGAVRVDGGPIPINLTSMRIQLVSIDGMPWSTTPVSPTNDGSFTVENLGPARYRVGVSNLPPGTWLQSIRFGDQEALGSGIELAPGFPGSLQITLGLGTGMISGATLDRNQQSASESVVTLVPDPMKEGRADLYRLVNTDRGGHFTVANVPPGEYRLFAWEEIEPGAHFDPEFLKLYESNAQKITVRANSQQNVSLTVTPPIK
jgi:hypothetical protein